MSEEEKKKDILNSIKNNRSQTCENDDSKSMAVKHKLDDCCRDQNNSPIVKMQKLDFVKSSTVSSTSTR